MKIKVALLIDEFFGGFGTPFGGYGFLARNYICKYIPNNDISIDVLLFMDSNVNDIISEKVDDVLLYKFPKNNNLVRNWLRDQNYDIFLSIELTYPSYEIMNLVYDENLILWIQDPRPNSVWLKRRSSVTLIEDPCVSDKFASELINYLYRENRITFISQGFYLNDLAKKLYNLPNNVNIQYMPNPIDLDWDFKFDIKNKKKQVIFLSRLEAQKRAWIYCEIAKKMPEYDFYLMGKFFRDEDRNKKTLEKYMQDNIANLHFTGHLEGKEKEKLIRESRILVNTSIWEGIPISWLEALQYGTAIVSCLNNEDIPSRFGEYVGEILGNGLDKLDVFVPAIKRLMEDDLYYSEKAIKAIKYVRDTHNLNNFIKNMRKLLIGQVKKQRSFISKIKRKNYTPKPFYKYINIKLTYNCNLKCPYCYQFDSNMNRPAFSISKEQIDNLLAMIGNEQYYLILDGGEPFVFEHIKYLTDKLSEANVRVKVITNLMADFDDIKYFLEKLKDKLDIFQISLHLSEYKNINIFYDRVRMILNIRKELNLDFNVFIQSLITNENFNQILSVKKDIKNMFNLDLFLDRLINNEYYNLNKYSKEIEEFFNSKSDSIQEKDTLSDNIVCWCGLYYLNIEADGFIYRCFTEQSKLNCLGNLSDLSGINILDKAEKCYIKGQGNKCVAYKYFENLKMIVDKNEFID